MKHNAHLIKMANSKELKKEMQRIGADDAGIHLMAPKGEILLMKLQLVSLKAANIIKQEMLARGGEAVLHKEVSMLTKDFSDIILIGTLKQLKEVAAKFKLQPFGLKHIAKEMEEVLEAKARAHKKVVINESGLYLPIKQRTLVMGILNLTPDSFSDGGKYNYIEKAIEHVKQMVEDGADIIDVGGESTRPDHTPVSTEEELQRVIPIIERLSQEIDVPISIDTYKAEVANEALKAGAHIINDVWGFKKDPNMAHIAAKWQVPAILMDNREGINDQLMIEDIISDLRKSISIAIQAGVAPSKIILDPGIGFGKTYKQNLMVMNRLDEIVMLGYPVLLGTSRKSMIGLTLNLPVTERVEGTAATVALGIMKGCSIIRVHDVKEMKRVATMMDAMVYINEE